jgi:Spy/CpxP family protein refolding chaperone
MWKRIWPVLGIASLALHVAFIGVSAAQIIRARTGTREVCATRPGQGEIWCPLHRRLGTTPEQWKRIEPQLAEFRTAALAVCEEVGRRRAEMIDLLSAPDSDRQAVAAKQEEILAGQRRMQRLVIEHLLAEKDVLTAAQQKSLFDLMRERSRGEGRGPLMGLSETGTKGRMSP